MKQVRAVLEAAGLFGIFYIVYEIMYYGYMFVIRYGLDMGWAWIKTDGYSLLNTDRTSLDYVRDHPVEYTLLCWAVLLVLFILGIVMTRGGVLREMFIRPLSVKNHLAAAVTGLGLVIGINGILRFVAEVMQSEVAYLPGDVYLGYEMIFLLITVGVITPVFEEVFFRGLILGRLNLGFGPGMSIFLTGIIFSVSHLNLAQGTFAFPVGIFCGYMVLRTGSVFAGIWLHIFYNAVNLYLAQMDFFQYNSVQLLVMIVFGLILVSFGINQSEPPKRKVPKPPENMV